MSRVARGHATQVGNMIPLPRRGGFSILLLGRILRALIFVKRNQRWKPTSRFNTDGIVGGCAGKSEIGI